MVSTTCLLRYLAGLQSQQRRSGSLRSGSALSTSLAADQATIDRIIEAAGKTNDKSFCGTKPIMLGIHDGFGINGWSKSSMAAVRSEAAKCPNVKQIVRIGQGGSAEVDR